VRRFLLILMAALPLATVAACNDTTGSDETFLSGDTALVLRAPTAEGPDQASALDARVPQAVAPEFPQFAGQWDFALRQSGTSFRFDVLETSTRSRGRGSR
jgi:hypothetical protein